MYIRNIKINCKVYKKNELQVCPNPFQVRHIAYICQIFFNVGLDFSSSAYRSLYF